MAPLSNIDRPAPAPRRIHGPVAAAARHEALFRQVDATAFDPKGFDPEKKHDLASKKPRIRCPHCQWQPTRRSRWYCAPMGAPEYFSGGCGTHWNTFDTAGKCPGCQYQWTHTSCLVCGTTSLHEAWYETPDRTA